VRIYRPLSYPSHSSHHSSRCYCYCYSAVRTATKHDAGSPGRQWDKQRQRQRPLLFNDRKTKCALSPRTLLYDNAELLVHVHDCMTVELGCNCKSMVEHCEDSSFASPRIRIIPALKGALVCSALLCSALLCSALLCSAHLVLLVRLLFSKPTYCTPVVQYSVLYCIPPLMIPLSNGLGVLYVGKHADAKISGSKRTYHTVHNKQSSHTECIHSLL
jgi:hypothetical protein